MPFKTADVSAEYTKNKQLREEDVKALQQWAEKQPHLPVITEFQLILILQSCYFSLEAAKTTIDNFYTVRRHCPEFFSNRDPCSALANSTMNVAVFAPLPKSTHENYRVLYLRLMDGNSNKFVLSEQYKSFDMNLMLWLAQEGTQEGLRIVLDMKLASLGHMTKLSIMTIKKFVYYLQEAMPVRLLGLHFINVVSFMDTILSLTKPLMKNELLDIVHIHADAMESLYKFVPKECLPKDFGGTADSVSDLHASMKKRLTENADYFKEEEKQVVDESQRPGKPKNEGDLFGVEGSFKKLDLD